MKVSDFIRCFLGMHEWRFMGSSVVGNRELLNGVWGVVSALLLQCRRCSKMKSKLVNGKWEPEKQDAEADELRKMAGLL